MISYESKPKKVNMMNLMKKENFLTEVKEMKEACEILMKTAHYSKLGADGIFAIVQKCRAVGIDPIEGLNGGMYYVKGKVEMTAQMMSSLIRKAGHSISCSEMSNQQCVLHGKRTDNGDTWKTSFSMDDAKRAGLLKNGTPWVSYPDIMLYSRALSKLARQLFSDVIGNAYVEGEMQEVYEAYEMPKISQIEKMKEEEDIELYIAKEEPMSSTKVSSIELLLKGNSEVRLEILEGFNVESFSDLPSKKYVEVVNQIKEAIAKKEEAAQ